MDHEDFVGKFARKTAKYIKKTKETRKVANFQGNNRKYLKICIKIRSQFLEMKYPLQL